MSIIIPTRGSTRELDRGSVVLIEQAVDSIVKHTDHDQLEIVVMATRGAPADLEIRLRTVVDQVGGARAPSLVVAHDDRPFNFSNVCNRGALLATGDLLVFLNDDTEVVDGAWLDLLGRHASRRDVGAVGAKLLYEDGSVQHCGIWTRGGHPAHRYEGFGGDCEGYLGALVVAQNCLAVTGACLAVERHKFELVGGFSPVFPNSYNDVDLCLKLLDRGFRTVVEPRATLFHFEASSRNPTISEQDMVELHNRWRWLLNNDPFDSFHGSPDGVAQDELQARFWPLDPTIESYAQIDKLFALPPDRPD